jgi:hypothetical protein
MNTRLLALIAEIDASEEASKIKNMANELAALSVKYQMIEINAEDAVLNYEDSVDRSATSDEKKAVEFGFMCGLECE